MQSKQIRYARDVDGNPRATLATIRNGDTIYFGVSVCSPKDHFNKKLGRLIAFNRAQKAQEEQEEQGLNNRFWGLVPVESVEDLLDTFYENY